MANGMWSRDAPASRLGPLSHTELSSSGPRERVQSGLLISQLETCLGKHLHREPSYWAFVEREVTFVGSDHGTRGAAVTAARLP